MEIDRSAPVLVTGATGYVAGWIIKRLLEEGLTVHAAVRDPERARAAGHLEMLAAEAPGNIRFFKADLLDPGSYAEAMKGCAIVFHTASPFVTNVTDPQRELIDPALLGTRNVLEEACRTPTVRRVVLTSSCAAIYGDNADLRDVPGGVLTEAIWNTSSSLDHQAYSFSKTLAEREAWRIADAQKEWRLVVVNPSFVMGPGTNPLATSESFTVMKQLGDGTMRTGVPDIGFGVVDVRDLADIHLAAAFTPGANGRYIASGHNSSLPEMARALLPRFGREWPLPRNTLPKALVWLVGPILNKTLTRKYVARNVGYPWAADNSRSIADLGARYRPLADTMNDFFEQLIASGQLRKRR